MEQGAKIKLGFVGGGPNSFIGHMHQAAASMHDQFELVAGVFGRDFDSGLLMPESCNWLRTAFTVQ